jgi:hypothetical protein
LPSAIETKKKGEWVERKESHPRLYGWRRQWKCGERVRRYGGGGRKRHWHAEKRTRRGDSDSRKRQQLGRQL